MLRWPTVACTPFVCNQHFAKYAGTVLASGDIYQVARPRVIGGAGDISNKYHAEEEV